MVNCPISNLEATVHKGSNPDRFVVDCLICGRFDISEDAAEDYSPRLKNEPHLRALLSHTIRKMQTSTRRPFLNGPLVEQILNENTLPTVGEQANYLIQWFGNQLKATDPASLIEVDFRSLAAEIGAMDWKGSLYIANELDSRGKLQWPGKTMGSVQSIGLTFDGWTYYEELQKSYEEGSIAFMAMQYGEEDIEKIYRECFKPAVSLTGFELLLLNEKPKAGLIDNRMRVEIRRSRFLIADLTHENRGAYWEAGFAEGLGKHVFYTCEESKFEKIKTHFDTEHQHTVKWDINHLDKAAEELKATIRATLPGEAKMSDD